MQQQQQQPTLLFYLESAVEDRNMGDRPVRILWFLAEPRLKPAVPREEAIQGWDYHGHPAHAAEAVDEMFTFQEAQMIRNELLRKEWEDARLKPVQLPVGPDLQPVGHIKESGRVRFYHLYREQDYKLPFAIAGCMVYGSGQVVDPKAWTQQAPDEISPSRPFGT